MAAMLSGYLNFHLTLMSPTIPRLHLNPKYCFDKYLEKNTI